MSDCWCSNQERKKKMSKQLLIVLAFAVAGGFLSASGLHGATQPENDATVQEEVDSLFEFGFDADFYTAYVYRNQVFNEGPVAQPCVWADFVGFDPFYLGFFIWQNYDLNNRRRSDMRGEWNETDYNIHLGATVWSNEDESMSLTVEVGHEWYDYNVKSSVSDDYPLDCEIYVKAEFETPFATPYGSVNRRYRDGDGMYYEVGLKRDFVLTEDMPMGGALVFGADWNVSLGSGKYLDYLYGVGRGYDAGSDEFTALNKDGVGGTTLKLSLTWQITDFFSLGGVAAYTSLLNETIRESYRDSGWYGNYRDDFVWGGVQAKFEF